MLNQDVYDKLVKAFEAKFGSKPETVSYAPGRIEVLGNHTDYNEGYVFSAAIDKGTFFACSKNDTKTCHLMAGDLKKEVVFPVTTDPESPTGQHKSLFCSLEVTVNGETIQHTVTDLGTLRIDPPAKKELASAKPAEAPKPAPAPSAETKRLSRLEQLRLEKTRKP